ncbi:uncharacterized protein METZ01_LOCUS186951, partial [marine metagenome]
MSLLISFRFRKLSLLNTFIYVKNQLSVPLTAFEKLFILYGSFSPSASYLTLLANKH